MTWLLDPYRFGAGAPAYTGPGDIVSFSAWYGLRAYSAAVAASGTAVAMRVRRISDDAEGDVLLAANGGLGNMTNSSNPAHDGLSLSAFLAATTGHVRTLFNQTGNSPGAGGTPMHFQQATAANQPNLLENGLGAFWVIENNASTENLQSANSFTPSGAALSLSVVGGRFSSNSQAYLINRVGTGGNGNGIIPVQSAAGQWRLTGSTTLTKTGILENVIHTSQSVISGASSVFNVDDSETTGSVTLGTSSGSPYVGFSLIRFVELGFIDNVALSAGERTALHNNKASYWGL